MKLIWRVQFVLDLTKTQVNLQTEASGIDLRFDCDGIALGKCVP